MRRSAHGLMHVGIIAVVMGLSKVHAAYRADPAYDFTSSFRLMSAVGFVVMLSATAYGTGLPDLPRGARSAVASATIATVSAVVVFSIIHLVDPSSALPRFVVFGSGSLLVPWYVICVALASRGAERDTRRDNIVIVGDWAEAADVSAELDRAAERPAEVCAVLTPAEARSTGSRRPLEETATGATVVVLDRIAQMDDAVVDQVAGLHERGVRVRTLSLFYEQWLGKLPAAELERVSLMFDIGAIHRTRYNRVKRVLDLSVCLMAAPVLAMAVPLVALGNRLGNRGPLLYRQERIGLSGQTFMILKFRTMRPSGDGSMADEWTGEDDPRITPFGRFLRRTHIDELPQLVNVVRGDLSIVGPRPEQPHYVRELSAKLPFYELRHLVRPGITGWAQVKYGYAGSERDALEKLQYDFYYLRRQSIAFDIRVIVRTLRSVLRGDGR